ncbi:TolC family outer membrane protein [Ferrimonas lipolytica]|uniref:TolC family outer membrane protein n=1 Tax=Ferrimonas lipolytica TaxID=2724191 RepID=A0A6H1UG12_9GAMM|nr:TolC family outer membrane protein [Ferrimonas lipolytica]QIZ78021.1 TolC family outer membrane protein [Ferrimonas lipolytica]
MKTIAPIVVLTSSMLLATAANAATLEQAVAYTLDTNPQIRLSFNSFKAREEQVNEARADYLPQVDLFANYGYTNADNPTGRLGGDHDLEHDPRQSGISLTQLIFDGFRTPGEVKRLGFEASAEQWALFSSAEDLALTVVQRYIEMLTAEQQLELTDHNLQNHQMIHEKIRQRSDSGLGSNADIAQSAGRLARANSNRIAAYNNLLDAQAQYRNVVNLDPDNLVTPVPDHDMLPKDLAEAILLTDGHPLLKSAAFDVDAAKQQRDVAKADNYPTLELRLDGTWGEELDNQYGHNNDLSATLEMRYNLFAGGATKARIRSAAYQLGSAKSVRERANRDVIEGMRLSWSAYEQLGIQKDYIRQHVEASKEAQLAYSEQFRLGQRTLLDLLDTENELFQARQDYVNSEMQELLAKYRVLNASGRLLDSLRVTRPPEWSAERDYQ